MQDIYSLVIEGKREGVATLIEEVKPYCIESRKTESCTGIEIATLIISALGFFVALISVPLLTDAINSKKVIVKIGGVVMNGSAAEILQNLRKDQELMNEIKRLFKSGTLETIGTAKQVVAFREGLRKLLSEENGLNEAL